MSFMARLQTTITSLFSINRADTAYSNFINKVFLSVKLELNILPLLKLQWCFNNFQDCSHQTSSSRFCRHKKIPFKSETFGKRFSRSKIRSFPAGFDATIVTQELSFQKASVFNCAWWEIVTLRQEITLRAVFLTPSFRFSFKCSTSKKTRQKPQRLNCAKEVTSCRLNILNGTIEHQSVSL